MQDVAQCDIAIVGAGASGLMAAIAARSRAPDAHIVVFERNDSIARKLYATGNGRCNYLNRTAHPRFYCSRTDEDVRTILLDSVFESVSVADLEQRFRSLGIPPVELGDGRLYPRSLQAESVVEALELHLRSSGTVLRTGTQIVDCARTPEGFSWKSSTGKSGRCKVLILATGGKAGIQYGSSGDGYKLAQSLGHSVVKPIPALTPLLLSEPNADLAGVRVRGTVSLWRRNEDGVQLTAEDEGEIQLTRDAVSGICTMNISRAFEIEAGVSYEVRMDFFPETERRELLRCFERRKRELAAREASRFLNGLLPAKLAMQIVRDAGIPGEKTVESLAARELERLTDRCKAYTVPVSGTKSWKQAQVTAGGVRLSEVDAESLQSKCCPSLYVTGELLDIDGPCGGFNLTWAFASGCAAGRCAARLL